MTLTRAAAREKIDPARQSVYATSLVGTATTRRCWVLSSLPGWSRNDPGYERSVGRGVRTREGTGRARTAVWHHSKVGAVGEHQRRVGAGRGTRGNVEKLARDVQSESQPSAGS